MTYEIDITGPQISGKAVFVKSGSNWIPVRVDPALRFIVEIHKEVAKHIIKVNEKVGYWKVSRRVIS